MEPIRVPAKPPPTRMRDGAPWYECTKSANVVKVDAVKSVRPREFKRRHYGVRLDIHAEMMERVGLKAARPGQPHHGADASRRALDLAIHLLRYEEEHRAQQDWADSDVKREQAELLERRRVRREEHLKRERDKAQFMGSWMNQGYDDWKRQQTRERQRVRRDLRFELSLLDAKKLKDQQKDANASLDQKGGVERFERNMTRLGIQAPIETTRSPVRESAQVYLQRIEAQVAETTGQPKEMFDMMSSLREKGSKNRHAQKEKDRRRRKMHVEQRKQQVELEVTRGEQERLDGFAERARAQRKLSEAIEEKRVAKETRAAEVTLKIAREIEERDKKGVEAFEIFAEEARERAKEPDRIEAVQTIIDEERAASAARKHVRAQGYAKDTADKFLDMVCVVLKIREDNGRRPMPFPEYRALKATYVGPLPFFVDDDNGPPPPGEKKKAIAERLAFEAGTGDWFWGVSHEERFGRDARDPVVLATETLALLCGDEPPSLRPEAPAVPSLKRVCVLGFDAEAVADGGAALGLAPCTPALAVAAALRKAEAAAAEAVRKAEAAAAEAVRKAEAAATEAGEEGEDGPEEETPPGDDDEAAPPAPPLQARGADLLQLPEATVSYESEEEEENAAPAPAAGEDGDELVADDGDELVQAEDAPAEDPEVVEAARLEEEARLEAKRARASERRIEAIARAAPDALLAATIVAFCGEAAAAGRGFALGGFPTTVVQAELLEGAFKQAVYEAALGAASATVAAARAPVTAAEESVVEAQTAVDEAQVALDERNASPEEEAEEGLEVAESALAAAQVTLAEAQGALCEAQEVLDEATAAKDAVLQAGDEPAGDAAPMVDALITLIPAPVPDNEEDGDGEETAPAPEAAPAPVDEAAAWMAGRAAHALTWAPAHRILGEERVAAFVCLLEDGLEDDADTPSEEAEPGGEEDKTLLDKFRDRKQLTTVLQEARVAGAANARLEARKAKISAKAAERVDMLSPAAKIWRDRALGDREVDLERARASIRGWHSDLEMHEYCARAYCLAMDDQRALIHAHCSYARKSFRNALREPDPRWDACQKAAARQMNRREITSTDKCRGTRLELTDELELGLGDIVDDRKRAFDEKSRLAAEKALERANKACELLGILASRLCAAESTRFASGCLTLDEFEEISGGEAACVAPADVTKRLATQLIALEEAVVIADDQEIGDKVRDTASLCIPLAAVDGARPARIKAPHTVQFASHSVRRLGAIVERFDRAEQLLRGIVGALRAQLDAMTAARVRVEHMRVGAHLRAFRKRVKADEVRVEPLVVGNDDGIDALLVFR